MRWAKGGRNRDAEERIIARIHGGGRRRREKNLSSNDAIRDLTDFVQRRALKTLPLHLSEPNLFKRVMFRMPRTLEEEEREKRGRGGLEKITSRARIRKKSDRMGSNT